MESSLSISTCAGPTAIVYEIDKECYTNSCYHLVKKIRHQQYPEDIWMGKKQIVGLMIQSGGSHPHFKTRKRKT